MLSDASRLSPEQAGPGKEGKEVGYDCDSPGLRARPPAWTLSAWGRPHGTQVGSPGHLSHPFPGPVCPAFLKSQKQEIC